MNPPGLEYVVIANDRQLREAYCHQHPRASTSGLHDRTHVLHFNWIRLNRLSCSISALVRTALGGARPSALGRDAVLNEASVATTADDFGW